MPMCSRLNPCARRLGDLHPAAIGSEIRINEFTAELQDLAPNLTDGSVGSRIAPGGNRCVRDLAMSEGARSESSSLVLAVPADRPGAREDCHGLVRR